MIASGTLAALFVYPVKGASGIRLDEAVLEPTGIAFDRRWMLIRDDGRMVTQRELPRLATLRTALAVDHLVLSADSLKIEVPFDRRGAPFATKVWGDPVTVEAQGENVDAAISAWAGLDLRLVRHAPGTVRACDPAHVRPGAHTGLSDGFPLLVTSTASLAALNDALAERGEEPVPMSRFRPNLVVSGPTPWAEDAARQLATPRVTLDLVKACERCSVTTTDQETGARHGPEPIATLVALGRRGVDGGPTFGCNAVPAIDPHERVTLRIGDGVHLS